MQSEPVIKKQPTPMFGTPFIYELFQPIPRQVIAEKISYLNRINPVGRDSGWRYNIQRGGFHDMLHYTPKALYAIGHSLGSAVVANDYLQSAELKELIIRESATE